MNPSNEIPAASVGSAAGRTLAMTGMAVLLVNVLLVAFDVMLRWLVSSPQSWVADIGSLTYPIALSCCVPAALESGHMIAIRFLGEAAGPRLSRLLDTFGSVLLSLMLVVVAWKTAQRSIDDWAAGYKTATIAIPTAPTWVIVAALLVFAALVQLRLTWRAFTQFHGAAVHA